MPNDRLEGELAAHQRGWIDQLVALAATQLLARVSARRGARLAATEHPADASSSTSMRDTPRSARRRTGNREPAPDDRMPGRRQALSREATTLDDDEPGLDGLTGDRVRRDRQAPGE